jgi:5-methylcytosine-specific restriction endonuclease McrA
MIDRFSENDSSDVLFVNCPLYKIPKKCRYKFLRKSMKLGKWIDPAETLVHRYRFSNIAKALIDLTKAKCYLCGHKAEHRHHVIPVCRGGRNELNNLVPLCVKCHDKFKIQRPKKLCEPCQQRPWVPKNFKNPFGVPEQDVVVIPPKNSLK